MPRHGECLKTNLGFPKDSEYFVRHILWEANFFTPSHSAQVSTCQSRVAFSVQFLASQSVARAQHCRPSISTVPRRL